MTDLAVFGSIAGSTVAWAAAEVLRSRRLWIAGAGLAVIHSAAALALFHGWSHHAAVAATAQRTAAVTGIAWGGGVFFNYAFLVAWIADNIWWWISPSGYERRPQAIDRSVRGFLFFMFLNGAVVFADGWMRLLGAAAVTAVSIAWSIRLFKRTVPA